jgi:DNA-directed RNA polymerase specialized sigma subunit
MNKCAVECLTKNSRCDKEKCRMWVDYKEDLNCALVTVYNNKGPMSLEKVAKRFDLSIVRIKQIQDKALQKLKKNNPLLK